MLTEKILTTKLFLIITTMFVINIAAMGQSLKILIIGNSLMYWNQLHYNLQDICKQNSKEIYLETIAFPGIELTEHFNSCPDSTKGYTENNLCFGKQPPAIKALKSRDWDIIILQGPYSAEASFPKQIIDSVRLYGGIKSRILIYENYSTILYSKPKRKDDLKKIKKQIRVPLKEKNIDFLPIGSIFDFVNTNYPEVNVFDDDFEHPNMNGSLLQIGIIYKALFKENPKSFFLRSKNYSNLINILSLYEAED